MSRFIESIKILDGKLQNLHYHQQRLERTRKELLGLNLHPDLSKSIDIGENMTGGLFKCRVIYEHDIENIEVVPYVRRKASSLKMITSDNINYKYKYARRTSLDELFLQRDNCDDIMIIINDLVTDSYTANLVFSDGTNWFTPDTPLLPGTMRASLLETGKIKERSITVDMIQGFKEIRLINALNDLDEAPRIAVSEVKY